MKHKTRVVHQSVEMVEQDNLPLVGPVYQSVKYELPSLAEVEKLFKGERGGYFYSRVKNPTVFQLEQLLAELQQRETAICFPSGVAAITVTLSSLLSSGDHVILLREGYKPSRLFISSFLSRFGVSHSIVGVDELDRLPQLVKEGKTRLVLFESPTNPTTRVPDISKLLELKQKGILLVMDNTFAGFHNHGELEIDFFIHSLTKFAGGHSDVMGGVVIGNHDVMKPVKDGAFHFGACLDPHSAFLLLRGMKTYSLRYQAQCASALLLAKRLEQSEFVSRVIYPGLESHPDRKFINLQMVDSGSIISFDVKGDGETLRRFIDSLTLVKLMPSLGCTESLIAPSKLFYGKDFSPEECKKAGLFETTARLSVGIEDIEDLWSDLSRALELA